MTSSNDTERSRRIFVTLKWAVDGSTIHQDDIPATGTSDRELRREVVHLLEAEGYPVADIKDLDLKLDTDCDGHYHATAIYEGGLPRGGQELL